ncbi:MAG: hypothetical protein VB078_03865 [Clostridiaceae bacterium]|nr:hypothetical protein [Clostridiaceae bacterium]
MESLRWRLNANFGKGDIHIVLHYREKADNLIKAEQDRQRFLKLLRGECRRLGLEWRYIACTDTKHMTNIHHHIVLSPVPKEVLEALWSKASEGRGAAVSLREIDGRASHGRLASYLMKESAMTALRYKKDKKRYKRFSCSQGMTIPQPSYRIIDSERWADEPSPQEGYILLEDDNGQTVRSGINEVSGWPWQEYTELWVGNPKKGLWPALWQNAAMPPFRGWDNTL